MRRICRALLCGTILTGSAASAQPAEAVEGVVRPDGSIFICDRLLTPDQQAEIVGLATFCPAGQRDVPAEQLTPGSMEFVAEWDPYGIPPPPTPPPPPSSAESLGESVSRVTSTLERHNFDVAFSPRPEG